MIAQPKLASADVRLATIARLNDRCRQGHDRTARIMVTRTCLGTFASGDSPMTIVVRARLLAAVDDMSFRLTMRPSGTAAISSSKGRGSTSGSTITTPRSSTARRIPPTPASPAVC